MKTISFIKETSVSSAEGSASWFCKEQASLHGMLVEEIKKYYFFLIKVIFATCLLTPNFSTSLSLNGWLPNCLSASTQGADTCSPESTS
jgi:hypothetical protein